LHSETFSTASIISQYQKELIEPLASRGVNEITNKTLSVVYQKPLRIFVYSIS